MALQMFSQLLRGTAIAKTAGTRTAMVTDAHGNTVTGIKVQNKLAKKLVGFLIAYCQTVVTDAEIMPDLTLELTNSSLGIAAEEIFIAGGSNDGDAASGYTPVKVAFVEWEVDPSKEDRIYGSTFIVKPDPSVSNTGGLDIVFCAVFANEALPPRIMDAWRNLNRLSMGGGRANSDNALAHATGGALVGLTALTIPPGIAAITGLVAKTKPNGITASDPISGYIIWTIPGNSGFGPCELPLAIFFNPALGTVTDGLNAIVEAPMYPFVYEFDGITQGELLLNASSVLLVAAGTAPDVSKAVSYRY